MEIEEDDPNDEDYVLSHSSDDDEDISNNDYRKLLQQTKTQNDNTFIEEIEEIDEATLTPDEIMQTLESLVVSQTPKPE